ncbi:hypothetical protein YK48G_06850 [Lentilactobacillus fungorum]|uniref:Uncharacterized protein n=1 Tax=Lentilactobacillus fungorum TaxID=2201250 RepID=A0ABQ3VXI6_9LACO|nr:hypothetical protein [Lentilactobacillus fungorum]GHP13260.1 hypothetical protein YK48G_06850 [Lentilactobacillus fungorum]
MRVTWKYSLLRNIPIFVIFILLIIQGWVNHQFNGVKSAEDLKNLAILNNISDTLLWLAIIIWPVHYFSFKYWYQKHPSYDPNRHQITKIGAGLTATGILLSFYLILGTIPKSYWPGAIAIVITFFAKDAFTTIPPE